MAREVLDLIREGKLDNLVIKLSSACRDRMRDQGWNHAVIHGERVVELPDD
jgi:hypothetical protein